MSTAVEPEVLPPEEGPLACPRCGLGAKVPQEAIDARHLSGGRFDTTMVCPGCGAIMWLSTLLGLGG